MEQITIEKMKLSEQLIKNLHGLGFEEVKSNLYSKQITENTVLFRDYRNPIPCSYAYFKEKRIHPFKFKESEAIIKIEKSLEFTPDKLFAYL